MSVASQKLELIAWISQLKDISAINQLLKVKKNASAGQTPATPIRKFGCGKDIFTYVAEDFDEPLEDLKDYMK